MCCCFPSPNESLDFSILTPRVDRSTTNTDTREAFQNYSPRARFVSCTYSLSSIWSCWCLMFSLFNAHPQYSHQRLILWGFGDESVRVKADDNTSRDKSWIHHATKLTPGILIINLTAVLTVEWDGTIPMSKNSRKEERRRSSSVYWRGGKKTRDNKARITNWAR